MKNFNVFGVQWKIRLLRGEGASQNNNVKGGLLQSRRFGQFVDLRRDFARKMGWCFWDEFDTSIHTISYSDHTFEVKTYFSLMKVLKNQIKKQALTCLLDVSWKLIYTNQSRFYNFFHIRKFSSIYLTQLQNFLVFLIMSQLQSESCI